MIKSQTFTHKNNYLASKKWKGRKPRKYFALQRRRRRYLCNEPILHVIHFSNVFAEHMLPSASYILDSVFRGGSVAVMVNVLFYADYPQAVLPQSLE